MKKIWIKKNWLVVFFILGLLFRLWLIYLFPQPFIFDQDEYHQIALRILESKDKIYLFSYRLSGYPMILAALYAIFGRENTLSWKILQAILDTTTAFLIFLIARNIFRSFFPSFLAFLLYLFNPFTSAYAGVRLTEVPTIFLATLIFFLLVVFFKKKDLSAVLVLGFILGFLPQVRPGFLYFVLLVLFFLIYRIIKESWKGKVKILAIALMLAVYILPFLYNIYGNKKLYGLFSPMTADNLFVREFYISLFVDNEETIKNWPAEVHQIYGEYSAVKVSGERQAMARKYFQLALTKIRENPQRFILSRFAKLWYVWEKHIIFPYHNFKNPPIEFFTYWGNVGVLCSGFLGYVWWFKKERDKFKRKYGWFGMLCGLFFVYTSLLHAFTVTSERFSLPAYPLVFLFCGFFFWRILAVAKKKSIILHNASQVSS